MNAYTAQLAPGSAVTIRLMDNQKLKGVFLGVEGDHVIVRLRSREPQPPLRIAVHAIFSMEAKGGGCVARPRIH